MGIAAIKKSFRRKVRFNGLVERAQQKIRMSRVLALPQIGLEIDVPPGSILIDCGANVGDITSHFTRTGAEVYAFEPYDVCFSVLQRRFSMTPNVTLFNAGVMDKECTLSLSTPRAHDKYDDMDSTVSGSFYPSRNDLDQRVTEVRCINLSDFIRSLGKQVRLLKLDIEGAEIEVINSLIDTGTIDRIDLTVVETHERQKPFLLEKTNALRDRIAERGLNSKVRLDWI